MKIPYGIADFGRIRQNGDFYVDKTPFLAKLERSELANAVFLRPRRMGKSSLISMMAHYYDLAREDQFDKLFGGLWVHEHPTPEKNAHVVLHLNFGAVRGTDEPSVIHAFTETVRNVVRGTLRRYFDYGSEFRQMYEQLEKFVDAVDLVQRLSVLVTGIDKRLYVLIDEYDTFASGLISAGSHEVYASLTERTGFVRRFYASLKMGSETGGISRIFITGVSPLLLDDIYTGFNIATNITTDLRFHALAGFTRRDVEQALDELLRTQPELAQDPRVGDRAVLMNTLERYYDGYRFSVDVEERMFNSDMVLYFLAKLQSLGKYPQQMLDPNARTDYQKFYGLFHASGQPIEGRREVLTTVLTEGGVSGKLVETLGMTPPPDPRDQFISLLFYTGLLTATTEPQTELRTRFEIPNMVIRELQWEHFSGVLKDSTSINVRLPAIVDGQRQMANEGEIRLFVEALHEHVMKVLGLKDMRNFREKHVKMILITSAVLSAIFQVLSEKEFAQGFCDLFWVPRPDNFLAKYSWMLELKYLSTNASEDAIEQAFQDAQTQLARYASDPVLVPILTKAHKMNAATLVFVGAKEIRCRPWPKGSGEEFSVPAKKAAAKKTKKARTKKRKPQR